MNLDNINDRLDIVNDLLEYLNSVLDSIRNKDFLDYILDDTRLGILQEKLINLYTLMYVESRFGCALDKMNDMKQSDEDSKWTFPLEKAFNTFIKEDFVGYIDNHLIDCSRSWSFDDYRARNFQNELYQKMTMLKGWYTETYLEDDDE